MSSLRPTPVARDELDLFEGSPYRMIRPLAVGGMAEVFLVAHRSMGKQFVAKVPHRVLASDPQIVDRMRVEAQALGRLSHPNIVSVAGFGTTADERPYVITEFLPGRSLSAELGERGRLPLQEALKYGCELLSALSAAHALGVVHRDVKPDNLFVCPNPDGSRSIKVLDFGVARVLPGAPDAAPQPLVDTTATGVLIGTPRFISPEAAMGARVDHRADIYSAALVIYLLVAGRGPFDHLRGDELLLAAHAVEEPEPVSRAAQAPLPSELDNALALALRKDPSERFQTASEFLRCIESVRTILAQSPRLLETSVYQPFREPTGEGGHPASAPDATPVTQVGGAASLSGPAAAVAFLVAALIASAVGAALVALLTGGSP